MCGKMSRRIVDVHVYGNTMHGVVCVKVCVNMPRGTACVCICIC